MLYHNLAAVILGCCHFNTWHTDPLHCDTCVFFLNWFNFFSFFYMEQCIFMKVQSKLNVNTPDLAQC